MYKKQSDIYKNHVASVLEFIYRTGQTSRIEIANNTGLTPALMTSITADLMEKEEIMETGDEISGISGSGRKRKLLTLNAAAGYLLGIEINIQYANPINNIITNKIQQLIINFPFFLTLSPFINV